MLDLIVQQHLGNKRIIRLNLHNEKTLILLKILAIHNYLIDPNPKLNRSNKKKDLQDSNKS
jgi:hypothetical protein